jgi:hypothetical protein
MDATSLPDAPSSQYWLDRQWIHDHYEQLVNDHGIGWIAVREGRVLAAGTNLGQVEDFARVQCPVGEIVLQFIDDGSLIY